MAAPIKKQIMDRVLIRLLALKATAGVRSITREMDIEKTSQAMPAIMLYDSQESESGKDTRGRTFRFTLAVKLLLEDRRDIQSAIDVMVAQVQQVMEGDIQLGGLATLVDGQDLIKYQASVSAPVGGAFLTYTIEYRRKLGDPYTTY